MDSCEHLYPTIDEHEGIIVCCDCGLVLENNYFVQPIPQIEPSDTVVNSYNNIQNEALELLTRLNLPIDIINNVPSEKQNVEHLYDIINKTTVVTTKEFCAASGIQNKKLTKCNKNKVLYTNLTLLLEKYCKLLDLSFRDYTLIKENVLNKPMSGHPPLTIIGYYIFIYCKSNKIKRSMKSICTTLGISTISIQRYRKYELSCRS